MWHGIGPKSSPHSLSCPAPVPRCPTTATNPGPAFGTPLMLPLSQRISWQGDRRRFQRGICGFTRERREASRLPHSRCSGHETSPFVGAAALVLSAAASPKPERAEPSLAELAAPCVSRGAATPNQAVPPIDCSVPRSGSSAPLLPCPSPLASPAYPSPLASPPCHPSITACRCHSAAAAVTRQRKMSCLSAGRSGNMRQINGVREIRGHKSEGCKSSCGCSYLEVKKSECCS